MKNPLPDIKTSEIIVELVERALHKFETQKVRDFKRSMSPEHFRHEFGTVKIKLPRRNGHTMAAVHLLTTYPGSILFVPNGADRRRIINEHRDAYLQQAIIYREDRFKEYPVSKPPSLEEAIFIPRDEERIKRIAPMAHPLVIMDRAHELSYMEKEGIYSIFENATLIIELE